MAVIRSAAHARWVALVVVCLGQMMSVLDGTVVVVALPAIGANLGFSQASLSWVVNGYLLAFGSLLLFFGRLGDLVGRRRVFLWGVTLFTAASAACGLAGTAAVLVIGRFVQGIGGAAAVSGVVAIIAHEFPDLDERNKAMSLYLLVVAAGGSLGLILGGLLTQVGWSWIFYINTPIGLVTILLGRRWISDTNRLGINRTLDVAGAVLSIAGLILVVYAIVTSDSYGWGSLHTLGFGGLGLLTLGGFVLHEHRTPAPIMPLRVFRVRGLASSSLMRALMFIGMYATFFIGVLFLEQVRHLSPLTTGLAFLAQTLPLAALSLGPITWLVRRVGPWWPTFAGFAATIAGLALLIRIGPDTSYAPVVLIGLALIGLGIGLAMTPLLAMGMAHVPPADRGLASGIINTSFQLAAAIGTAVLATVSSNRTNTLQAAGEDATTALVGGYQLAFIVAIGCVAAGLTVAIATLAASKRRSTKAI